MPVSGGNQLIDPKKIFERVGLKQGDKIADLGCGGAGHFTFPAAELVGESGMVYAVDILKSVLESIDSEVRLHNYKNIKTVWSDVERFGATKIPDRGLDLVLLINILFQSKNHAGIIKEASRMIRSFGRLLVVDWKQTGAPFGPDIKDRVPKESVISLAQAHGLDLVDDFDAGQYHYALLFQKR